MSNQVEHSGDNPAKYLPDLYGKLAGWFHLLTAPEDYANEAAFYRSLITGNSPRRPVTVLELGSGGGNNASHLKAHFKMTLVDLSPEMLDISRRLNPECEHIQGDMRNIRLGRQFDAIFIHDAISYLTTEQDLAMAIETAFAHCRPGGVALFVPDYTRENFVPSTSHGGHDADNRGLRYLSWVYDPEPGDTTYIMDMVYLMKEGEIVRCQSDRHIMGLFSESDWRNMMNEAGFSVQVVKRKANWPAPMEAQLFLGIRPDK
jgi:SAM-dependent methyltransferase